jgi:hypothetical protein
VPFLGGRGSSTCLTFQSGSDLEKFCIKATANQGKAVSWIFYDRLLVSKIGFGGEPLWLSGRAVMKLLNKQSLKDNPN